MSNAVAKYLVVVVLLLLVGIMGLIAYWMVYPYHIMDIKQPVVTEPKEYTVGQRLGLNFDYCIYMAVPTYTKVRFLRQESTAKHVIDTLEDRNGVSKIGCNKITSNTFVIPQDFTPGMYELEIKTIFYPNPIRAISVTILSEKFEIK